MRLFGVKGFTPDRAIPQLVWHVRAMTPERAEYLVSMLPQAAGLRLQAVDIGDSCRTEGVFKEIPWPWPNKEA